MKKITIKFILLSILFIFFSCKESPHYAIDNIQLKNNFEYTTPTAMGNVKDSIFIYDIYLSNDKGKYYLEFKIHKRIKDFHIGDSIYLPSKTLKKI